MSVAQKTLCFLHYMTWGDLAEPLEQVFKTGAFNPLGHPSANCRPLSLGQRSVAGNRHG